MGDCSSLIFGESFGKDIGSPCIDSYSTDLLANCVDVVRK